MPAHRLVPSDAILKKWVDQGLTHQQIADRILADTGERVSRSTVSAALSRAGLVSERARFDDVIPWRVRVPHLKAYPVRMLRLLGRRIHGLPMNDMEVKRLDSWLQMLKDEDAVVAYSPDSEQGFYYVDPRPGVDGIDGIPVRKGYLPIL